MVTSPSRVAVVGAGMVGLSTAWFLNEQGVEVTVLERTRVAAGSSWGNAGWITPGLATPLPDPSVLAYGIKAVLSPSSPVYVPPSADPRLLTFLARFARNSTPGRWRAAMDALIPINRVALPAFDAMADGGVRAPVHEARPFLAAFRTEQERQGLLDEVAHIRAQGQGLDYDVLDAGQTLATAPLLTDEVGAGLVLHGQRYLTPSTFVADLAATLVERGVKVREGSEVVPAELRTDSGREPSAGVNLAGERFDAVVVATGTWLGELGRGLGVRAQVRSGRGYSFTVPVASQAPGPLYFPRQRVACTPVGDRLRVAGMMEFRPAAAPLDPRRISAVVEAARPLVRGVDWDDRQDEWVGSRPCTVDGLPLIGATTRPDVFVAGGHGMWGMTLGPATGQLLAEQIITGRRPAELAPFDPLR